MRTDLVTGIAGFANGGNNPASEFRTFMTAFLDAVYKAPFKVLSTATTYAIPTSNTTYPYHLLFNKIGGRMFVNGYFYLKSANPSPSGQVIATLTDTELLVNADTLESVTILYRGRAKDFNNGVIVDVVITKVGSDTVFKANGIIPANTANNGVAKYEIIDDFSYNTLN